jgi:hypothetical protein
MVGWDFRSDYEKFKRSRAAARAIGSFEGALPDSYGMKPAELAALLEQLRAMYG